MKSERRHVRVCLCTMTTLVFVFLAQAFVLPYAVSPSHYSETNDESSWKRVSRPGCLRERPVGRLSLCPSFPLWIKSKLSAQTLFLFHITKRPNRNLCEKLICQKKKPREPLTQRGFTDKHASWPLVRLSLILKHDITARRHGRRVDDRVEIQFCFSPVAQWVAVYRAAPCCRPCQTHHPVH